MTTDAAQSAEGQPAVPGPPPLEAPPPLPERLPFRFTGSGGEYFRIWLVNLLLTLVTLGVYSAWAKVRKTRYFWSNTQLGGAAFQYHGNPLAILRGRILVGVLFVAYSLAGRISILAGVVAATVLAVLAPWFFLKAMRFKLTNTTWRGLRFGFDSTVGAAYAPLAPAVILWVLLTAVAATLRPGGDGPKPILFLVAYGVAPFLVPFLHARIKRYQHGAAILGARRFQLQPSTGAFYALYGKTLLVALLLVFPVGIIAVLVVVWTRPPEPGLPAELAAFLPVAHVLLSYVLAGSFFVARLQRLVWTRTRGGELGFATSVRARGLLWTWLRNGLLTLVTIGLYWPWAAVNIARYRIESMTLEAGAPLAAIAAGRADLEPSAAGEGAVDLFGWDVGL